MKKKYLIMSPLLLITILAYSQENYFAPMWIPDGGTVRALAADESGYLYAATQDNGVFRSVNNGKTWSPTSTSVGPTVYALLSHKGIIFAGTANSQIYSSIDHGDHWDLASSGLPSGGGQTLCFAATPGDTLYAGLNPGGLFSSTDQGKSWRQLISQKIVSKIFVNQYGHIFIQSGGLTRSTDAGASWYRMANCNTFEMSSSGDIYYPDHGSIYTYDRYNNFFQLYVGPSSINYDMITSDGQGLVQAFCGNSVLTSTDYGKHWNSETIAVNPVSLNYSLLRKDSLLVLANSMGGIYISNDAGKNWNLSNSGLSALPIMCIIQNPAGGRFIFAGSGPELFSSYDQGATWQNITPKSIRLISTLTFDEKGALYVGSRKGVWVSTDTGKTWNPTDTTTLKGQISCLASDTAHGVIYAGTISYGGYKSTSYGTTWIPINTGLTGTSIDGLAIDVSGNVYVSKGDALYRSTNQGQQWASCLLGQPQKVWSQGNRLYVLQYYSLFASDNSGASFDHISDVSLPNSAIVPNSCIVTNANFNFFTAPNFYGVFNSKNQGLSWHDISSGLKNKSVDSLYVDSSGFLYVGTNSELYRSIYSTTQMQIALSALFFDSVKVGKQKRDSIIVMNTGPSPRTYYSFSSSDSCMILSSSSAVVQPHSAYTLYLTFRPSEMRAYNSSVVIVSNEIDSISVSGIGYKNIFNVALGKPISVMYTGVPPSSSLNADPSRLVDGSLATWLIIDGKASGYDNTGTSITLSLTNSYDIDRIKTFLPFGQSNSLLRIRGFKLYISNDSLNWKIAIDRPQNDASNIDTALTPSQSAKYLKLVVTQVDCTSAQTAIAEWEVYGSDSDPLSAINEEAALPNSFMLTQNYPNPFNSMTTISFVLPVSMFASLKIYDLLGREVSTIAAEQLSMGKHSYRWNGDKLTSGVYFYRLQAGPMVETKKLVLLK